MCHGPLRVPEERMDGLSFCNSGQTDRHLCQVKSEGGRYGRADAIHTR